MQKSAKFPLCAPLMCFIIHHFFFLTKLLKCKRSVSDNDQVLVHCLVVLLIDMGSISGMK